MKTGTPPIRVTLVEDNWDFREELAFALRQAGMEVTPFPDSRGLDAHLTQHPCDILLLDVGLPGETGLAIARRVRATHDLAIVMLTSRDSVDDKVSGLEQGADVYLVKPVAMRELIAVIHSQHRRRNARHWRLDLTNLCLVDPDQQRISLTLQERYFLSCLALSSGKAVSRQELIEALGGDLASYDAHRLEALVSRLRRKLESHGHKELVQTVYGTGYALGAQLVLTG